MDAESRSRLYTNLDSDLAARDAADKKAADALRVESDKRVEALRREQEEREILTSPEVSQVIRDIHSRIRRLHSDASISIANPNAETYSGAPRPKMGIAIWWELRVQPDDGFENSYWKEIGAKVARYLDGRIAGLQVTGQEFESPVLGLSNTEGLAIAFEQAYPHPLERHGQGFVDQHGPKRNRLPYPEE